MYGKIIIHCVLTVKTGLHIGDSSAFSAIGAVDSPVVRDPYTNRPIIPGSSLKGKIRTLLVRSKCKDIEHMPDHKDDDSAILRLFGSAAPVKRSRLQFADCFVSNASDFASIGLTEVKAENTINRQSSQANPRQIERVTAGVQFGCTIVYDIENSSELTPDLQQAGEQLAADGIAPLYFSLDGHAAGLIGVADAVKPASKAALDALKALGLDVILLTGDSRTNADRVAAQVGLDDAHVVSGLAPAELEAELRNLLTYLREDAPQVISTRNAVKALQAQIDAEQSKITAPDGKQLNSMAADFDEIKARVTFDTEIYSMAIKAIEKTRLETARKLKVLSVISSPQLPEESSFPSVAYLLASWLLVCCLLFGTIKLLLAVIEDHKD